MAHGFLENFSIHRRTHLTRSKTIRVFLARRINTHVRHVFRESMTESTPTSILTTMKRSLTSSINLGSRGFFVWSWRLVGDGRYTSSNTFHAFLFSWFPTQVSCPPIVLNYEVILVIHFMINQPIVYAISLAFSRKISCSTKHSNDRWLRVNQSTRATSDL